MAEPSRRARRCGNKARHATRDAAIGHLVSLRKAGGWTWNMLAYHCRHCGAWHVGHRPRSGRKK